MACFKSLNAALFLLCAKALEIYSTSKISSIFHIIHLGIISPCSWDNYSVVGCLSLAMASLSVTQPFLPVKQELVDIHPFSNSRGPSLKALGCS